ncbi:hypothetical protein D3C75_992550 [compost metagenome]
MWRTIRTIGSQGLALWSAIRTVGDEGLALRSVIRTVGGEGLALRSAIRTVGSQALALWSAIRTIGSNGVLLLSGLGKEAIFLIARYSECGSAQSESSDGDQLANSFHGGDSGRNQGFWAGSFRSASSG